VEDQAAHPPFGTNLSHPLERYVRVHQTSGTTGAPLRWLDTQESWEWWARCWGFVLRGAGLGPGDRVFFPFSFGLFVGFWAGFEGARASARLRSRAAGLAQRLAAMETLGAPRSAARRPTRSPAEVARERGAARPLGVRAACTRRASAGIPRCARIEAAGARAYDHAGMTEMGA
jgi:phenylacetate-CoA ligase